MVFISRLQQNVAVFMVLMFVIDLLALTWSSICEGDILCKPSRDLSYCLNRGPWEMDFFLCQFLTGYGHFKKYLHGMENWTFH